MEEMDRLCLWCEKKFWSRDAGERKCPKCRLKRSLWRCECRKSPVIYRWEREEDQALAAV